MLITGNTISDHISDGIYVESTSQSITISGNSVTDNTGYGIYNGSTGLSPVQNNTITGNTYWALGVYATSPILNNTMAGNGVNGVRIFGGTINTSMSWSDSIYEITGDV
ncbi:MAG: right-handed parallel beta-helix repeat-containing protein, partial [Candidatus Dadabacteria bacterium]|nr:right-handed parallel beta-helix repeat-containing protein [Candidatus Dadabacteria bacterium]